MAFFSRLKMHQDL